MIILSQNDKLGYYKNGYDYGAMNASFTKTSDGTWWWPKTFNNPGIFRFKDSDIGSSSVSFKWYDGRRIIPLNH